MNTTSQSHLPEAMHEIVLAGVSASSSVTHHLYPPGYVAGIVAVLRVDPTAASAALQIRQVDERCLDGHIRIGSRILYLLGYPRPAGRFAARLDLGRMATRSRSGALSPLSLLCSVNDAVNVLPCATWAYLTVDPR